MRPLTGENALDGDWSSCLNIRGVYLNSSSLSVVAAIGEPEREERASGKVHFYYESLAVTLTGSGHVQSVRGVELSQGNELVVYQDWSMERVVWHLGDPTKKIEAGGEAAYFYKSPHMTLLIEFATMDVEPVVKRVSLYEPTLGLYWVPESQTTE